MTYWRGIWMVIIYLLLASWLPADAQSNAPEACPAFVSDALNAVANACGDLERNQACYGNNHIIAEFWQARDDLVFSQPSDRVTLVDLRRLVTAALNMEADQWGVAALRVQANIPDTLPGQAVTMLLMGDASLENAVSPDQVRLPVSPVQGRISTRANLRSLPTTAANVVGGLDAGQAVRLVGINASGDWFEIEQESGLRAWVNSSLIAVSDPLLLAGLPVTDETAGVRYAPMQAFYFKNRPGESICQQAPSMLVVQSPQQISVVLNINGLEFSLGSTLLFMSSQLEDGTPVLVGTLIEGTFTAHYLSFAAEMTRPGQTFAVTLNAAGQVDEQSRLVDLGSNAEVDSLIHYGCQSLMDTPLLPEPPASCDFSLDFDVESPVGGGGDLSGVGPQDACTIAAGQLVNLRGGPGTNYAWNGQLQAGELATPDGYAVGADGKTWYRLSNGLWVRSDLVNQAGACAGLPAVVPPEAPAVTISRPPSGGSSAGIFEISHHCADLNAVRAGQTITFQDGIGRWATPAEKEAALVGHSAIITVDGAPLSVYYEGTTLHTGDGAPDGYGDRARADWVATPGTHTVAGFWTSHGGTDSCVFTIAS